MLRVHYRYCPVERPEVRPKWFSKQLGLVSFAQSLKQYFSSSVRSNDVKWTLYIDRFEELNSDENGLLYKLSKQFDIKIVKLKTKSNTKAYQCVLNEACLADDKDKILFVEDDYLWLPEAIMEMNWTMDAIPEVDYLTPYDHPVRYDFDYYGGVDLPHWENRIFLSGNRHYRTQESTCMTFMTRGKVIKHDRSLHLMYSPEDKKCPNDRELFRRLQHLGGYIHNIDEKRLLLGPMPSLATHVHEPYLAPIIDWEKLANTIKKEYQKLINSL